MLEKIKNNPALIVGLVQAIIALGVAFGLDLTPEQIGAVLAVLAGIMALVVRSQVTGPVTASKLEAELDTLKGAPPEGAIETKQVKKLP